jgi:hypothetical protein
LAERVHAEVDGILLDALARARALLAAHRPLLEVVVAELLAEETIDLGRMRALRASVEPGSGDRPGSRFRAGPGSRSRSGARSGPGSRSRSRSGACSGARARSGFRRHLPGPTDRAANGRRCPGRGHAGDVRQG